MLEGTIEHDGAVFGIHCHIVPTTDPDVRQMIAFRDLLRGDRSALEAYANDKHRIAAATEDPLEYTAAKTELVDRLLEDAEVRAAYDAGAELDRLDRPLGLVEFERTKEILGRHLPAPPISPTSAAARAGTRSGWRGSVTGSSTGTWSRLVLFDALRALERVPELLGVGPHLLLTALSR
jgi:hypothetical protein